MLNYHHEPTNTSVETTTGNVHNDTPWVQTRINTQYVTTSTTSYDNALVGVWTSQSIHLSTTDDVYAYVQTRDDGRCYMVVKLDQHDTIFVPMEIADAIAGALAVDSMKSDTEAVAS